MRCPATLTVYGNCRQPAHRPPARPTSRTSGEAALLQIPEGTASRRPAGGSSSVKRNSRRCNDAHGRVTGSARAAAVRWLCGRMHTHTSLCCLRPAGKCVWTRAIFFAAGNLASCCFNFSLGGPAARRLFWLVLPGAVRRCMRPIRRPASAGRRFAGIRLHRLCPGLPWPMTRHCIKAAGP